MTASVREVGVGTGVGVGGGGGEKKKIKIRESLRLNAFSPVKHDKTICKLSADLASVNYKEIDDKTHAGKCYTFSC